MTDRHFDDLASKARRGGLTDAERRRLDEHVAECPTCRFEKQAARDLAAEFAMDGADDDVLARLIASVEAKVDPALGDCLRNRVGSASSPNAAVTDLERGSNEPVRGRGLVRASSRVHVCACRGDLSLRAIENRSKSNRGSETRPARLARRPARRAALVVLVAVLVASSAAAVMQVARKKRELHVLSAPGRSALVEAPAAARAGGAHATASSAPEPSPEPAERPLDTAPRLLEGTEPASRAPSQKGSPAAPSVAMHAAPPRAGPSGAEGAAAAPSGAPLAPSAADLFRVANERRRDGDAAEAARLYRELLERFPRTRESAVARINLGRLLEPTAPSEALVLYDAYLAGDPGGPLEEEALVGRATALRSLGRADDERAAWARLLHDHPGSVYAPRARERLGWPR